ncbi:ATP-binding protein [Candidatus Uhrbacteria bacterium]|nr:ATP-binding protein [Candidatus Uhrbacteria bacterium]
MNTRSPRGSPPALRPVADASAPPSTGASQPVQRKLRRQWHSTAIIFDMRNYTFEKWLKELIDNSLIDYGAQEIRINITRDKRKVTAITVVENGVGMTCDRASRFLGIGRPDEPERRNVAGRTGRGFRYGAFGGTGCTRIAVRTVSDETPDSVLCLDFSLREFISPPAQDGDERDPEYRTREEAQFPYRTGTGTVFVLSGFEEPNNPVFEGGEGPRIPASEELRELISQEHPLVASKIRVDGVVCTPRKLDGVCIERTVSTGAGTVRSAIWVLKKPESGLRLTFGPMSLAEFYTQLVRFERRSRIPEDRRASRRFPQELLDPRVVGVIEAQDLHWRFKTGGQAQFQEGVFSSRDLAQVIGEGLADLGQQVAPHLTQAETSKVEGDERKLIELLAGAINARCGYRPGVAPGGDTPDGSGDPPTGSEHPPVVPIRLVPASVEMETGGDQQLFTLENVPHDGVVTWGVTGGGTIHPDPVTDDERSRGVRHATFESGDRAGSYEVRAALVGRDGDVWASAVTLRLPITRGTAEHPQLRLVPSRRWLSPGDQCYVRIRDRSTGKLADGFVFDWLESDPNVITVTRVGSAGTTALITAVALGTGSVVARDRGNSGIQFRGNYEVRNPPAADPPGGASDTGDTGGVGTHNSPNDIQIHLQPKGGVERTYILRTTRAGGVMAMHRRPQMGTGHCILEADMEHHPLRTAKRPHAFLRELLRLVVQAYVADEAETNPDLTPAQSFELFDRILAQLTDSDQL